MVRRVVVSAPSRIHMGLVDLSGDLGRVDGGVGFAIKLPRTVVVAQPHPTLKYVGPRVEEVVPRLENLGLKGLVIVRTSPPPHVGLGSTTQLVLASAKALASINAVNLSSEELASLVGRGGTSGIGVAVFERGGFVVDFGHDLSVKGRPLPSGASLAAPPPYIRLDFPEEWAVLLAFPEEGTYDEVKEVDEFLKYTPIPPEESSRAARIVMMLLIPGVLEKRLDLFAKGINEMQKVGFKKIELDIQPKEVRELRSEMEEIFGNAGLSSMGPCVYSVLHKRDARRGLEKLRKIVPSGWNAVLSFPDNEGAVVA